LRAAWGETSGVVKVWCMATQGEEASEITSL
jgi:hypothetical protein